MTPTPTESWHTALADLRPWKRGSTRAVHKPLLTLMLIARASRNEPREVSFAEIAEPLSALLKEFGPSSKYYRSEYPFWHLKNNGFWVVRNAKDLPLKKAGSSPAKSTLLNQSVTGYVKKDLWAELVSNRSLRANLADKLLFEFWPETLHPAIREALGLVSEVAAPSTSRPRDPRFREEVLRAYRGQCAVCGYDGRLAGNPLGIQAAHVKWHSYDGPDDLSNGLALCSFHHLALDSGAIGLDESRRVLVSCDVAGSHQIEELLYRHEGRTIREPQLGLPTVQREFIAWHTKAVLKKPTRLWSSGLGGASLAAEPEP